MKDKPTPGKGFALYRRLLTYVKPLWLSLVIAALGNVIYAAMDGATAYLFKPIIDKGFVAKDYHFIAWLPLIIIGLFVLRGVGNFISTYFMGYFGARIVMNMRQELFAHMMKLPARFFDLQASGRLLAVITYNVGQITSATGSTLVTLVRQSFTLVFFLIIMFHNSWQLTLILLLIVPPLVLLIGYVSLRLRKLSRRIQNSIGDIAYTAEESLVGYREVQVFNAQKQQVDAYNHNLWYNYRQQMKVVFTEAISTPVILVIGAGMVALIVYIAIGRGHFMVSPGAFSSMFAAMIMSFQPIKSLSRVNNGIQKGLAGAESVFNLLDEKPAVDEGTQILKAVKGKVIFDHVTFAYHENHGSVLKDVSFEIPSGKTVALVGPSGGGKSTIVSLLARFYHPTEGKITIDGHNLEDIKIKSLRDQIALVSQHVVLFDDTLFNNIAFGMDRKNTTKAKVIAAAKAANAWSFIEKLPDGLNTTVGQNGLQLSGGQRQRIAIARAILKDAPILILDEATAALDNDSERAIQQALDHLRKGRSTLIIAHRLSTIEKADKILVMQQGEIVESGTHQTLMAQNGIYAQLQHSANFDK